MRASGRLIIGICDDDTTIYSKIDEQLRQYLSTLDLTHEFHAFENQDELLNFCQTSDKQLDLLLMDIELPHTSGIELSELIHYLQPDCQIAYNTNYIDYAPDVYETVHCYYILKEQFADRLPYVIRKVLEAKEKKKEKVIIDIHSGKALIYVNDILYIERKKRTSYITLSGHTVIETSMKLDELLELFHADEFIRCHNSYVVSFSKIRNYYRYTLIMEDETEIPISRQYMETVKGAFVKWCGNQF